MKTFPLTALQTDECPPHLIKIKLENISNNGKPVWHQIGRCSKNGCKVVKDYGQMGDGDGKIATVRSRAVCAKGGKKRKKEVKDGLET